MDSLPRHILATIQSDRYGGRTIRTDEETVVLYDCGLWSDGHSSVIRERFPECDIAIHPSQASLSGFLVVFKLRSDRSVYLWASLTILLLMALFLTARQVLSAGKRGI